ncbi:MAG TPA: hypothetical protein VFG47_23240, partial [Geminicoccaceae bacterium]|nr:hypothetical protein [Geminicoccaceae bacterium]
MAVPSAGEGPQPQHDLQAQVAALLALELQGRSKREWPITSIVAGLAALFAAVASALGAAY